MSILLTPNEALEIQERHIKHYGEFYSGGVESLRAKLKSMTNLDGLNLDQQYSVFEINKRIPRGGDIEYLVFGKDQGGE